jgi:hypothetical protein
MLARAPITATRPTRPGAHRVGQGRVGGVMFGATPRSLGAGAGKAFPRESPRPGSSTPAANKPGPHRHPAAKQGTMRPRKPSPGRRPSMLAPAVRGQALEATRFSSLLEWRDAISRGAPPMRRGAGGALRDSIQQDRRSESWRGAGSLRPPSLQMRASSSVRGSWSAAPRAIDMNGGARPLPWGGAPGFAAGSGLPPGSPSSHFVR